MVLGSLGYSVMEEKFLSIASNVLGSAITQSIFTVAVDLASSRVLSFLLNPKSIPAALTLVLTFLVRKLIGLPSLGNLLPCGYF